MDIPSIILSVLIAVVVTALFIVYRKQRQRSLLSQGMVVDSNSDEESYLQASERDYGVPDEVVSVHTFGMSHLCSSMLTLLWWRGRNSRQRILQM